MRYGEEKKKLEENEIYNILDEEPKYIFDGKEKDYEEYVKENLQEICENLDLPKIDKTMQQNRFNIDSFSIKPDLLVHHIDGSLSVFEIKCCNYKYPSTGASEQAKAIGQLLLYKNVLEELRKDIVRVFLVDQKIFKRTVCIFSGLNLPIGLIELQNNRVFIPYNNS